MKLKFNKRHWKWQKTGDWKRNKENIKMSGRKMEWEIRQKSSSIYTVWLLEEENQSNIIELILKTIIQENVSEIHFYKKHLDIHIERSYLVPEKNYLRTISSKTFPKTFKISIINLKNLQGLLVKRSSNLLKQQI